MFTVEQATSDVSDAFIPYFALHMARELLVDGVDLSHPDLPLVTLVRRGYSARVVVPCLDLALRLAKEARPHAASVQPQPVS